MKHNEGRSKTTYETSDYTCERISQKEGAAHSDRPALYGAGRLRRRKCEARLPQKQVEELSFHKAMEIAEKTESTAVVIGADTLVFFRGKPLGKPRDEKEATLMLKALQGQTHQVYTGVTLIWHQGKVCGR